MLQQSILINNIPDDNEDIAIDVNEEGVINDELEDV